MPLKRAPLLARRPMVGRRTRPAAPMTDKPAPIKPIADKPRILLGEIGAAHGIRGEFVVRSFTADPADIAAYGRLHAADRRELPDLRVVRVTQRGVICRFDGITDRTTAETLRGTELWVDRDHLPPPDPDDYYHADLIGLSAVMSDGAPLGTIVTVANFGAGDLLEIKPAAGGPTEYIPFTHACVPDVDIAARRVTVVPPEIIEGEENVHDGADPEGQGAKVDEVDPDQSPG